MSENNLLLTIVYKHLINIIKVSYLISPRFTYILNYQCLNNICCFIHILQVRKCSKMTFPKIKHTDIKYMSCHMCYQRNRRTSVMTTCKIIYVDLGQKGCTMVHKILKTMYMTCQNIVQLKKPTELFFLSQISVLCSKLYMFQQRRKRAKFKFRVLKCSLTICLSLYNVANVNSELTTVRAFLQFSVLSISRLPF